MADVDGDEESSVSSGSVQRAILMLLQCLLMLVTGTGLAQDAVDTLSPETRDLVAGLTLDQASDEALFERVGFDHAFASLNAVMQRGLASTASPREWTDMHRAIAGLVELSVAKGELFKAVIYANFQ